MTDWRHYVRSHLPPLSLGSELEMEIVEEMALHLESVYEAALARGASEQEARLRAAAHIRDWQLLECELIRAKRPRARLRINHHARFSIQSKTRRGGMLMGSLLQDLRYGARMLIKSKVFTGVAVLSLALGIGASTAIFSLLDAVLLKMLPVKEPQELVLFNWLSGPNRMMASINGSSLTDPATGMNTSTSFSYLTFERLREHNETLASVFAFAPLEQLNVNVDGQAEIAAGQLVSGDYYAGLGVEPALGRLIRDEDDHAGASPVAVITHRYFERRFALDPEVIGKSVNVNNVAFTIIGVTPPAFSGALEVGESPDLSIPLAMEPQVIQGSRSLAQPWFWWLRVMGRVKPEVSEEQARASLEVIFQESALDGWTALQARLQSLGRATAQEPRDTPLLRVASGGQGLTELRQAYSRPLMILMIVVGLVLVVACANLANLLVARAAQRQKEIAVRLALGASRFRLIRQLLTESLMLALAGGALGALLAYWAKDILLALRPWGGSEIALDLKLDLRVLGFTLAVSLITGLLFGLAPALRATRIDLTPTLKDQAGSLTRSRSILSKSLIVAQVAMSLVLLVGAGLFLRTLGNLHSIDVGFNSENLLLFRVDPRLSGYKGPQIASLYRRMIEGIESVPGVRSATLSRHPLLSGSARTVSVSVQGHTSQEGEDSDLLVNTVAPNFLETMGIPLLFGRSLTPHDDERAPKVAVINQAMARKYFADDNPIGRRFGMGGPETSGQIEIIGVARDAKYTSLRREMSPTAYVPYLQDSLGQANFSVRIAGDATALTSSIREAVREVDANLPLFDVKTQSQQTAESLAQERLFATLSSFFGLLALVLASIGLYGVMSYSVARRTSEIGIRMALGAEARDVTRMVMSETIRLVFTGIAIGLGAALAVTRLISSMLFGLAPTDPLTISLAVFVMIAVAALAGYLPARRASQVDPLAALKYE